MLKKWMSSGTYSLRPVWMIMIAVSFIMILSLQVSAQTLACEPNEPCETEVGSIGDLVWEDLNNNGIQDDGEPGIEGVTVNLYKCCSMALVATTTTDENGNYLFVDVPGNIESYYVEFVLPPGWEFTIADNGHWAIDSDANPETGITECTNLENCEVDLSWDAGMVRVTNNIPEFPSIALPMAGIIGLALIFRKRNE